MGLHFEAQQDLVFVGQIADDAAQREWELLDQRWRRQDFLVFRALWILEDVDDLEFILALELIFAKPLQVRDRDFGTRAGAGDVKDQEVFSQTSSPAWCFVNSALRQLRASSKPKLRLLGPLVALRERCRPADPIMSQPNNNRLCHNRLSYARSLPYR